MHNAIILQLSDPPIKLLMIEEMMDSNLIGYYIR